MNQQQYEDFSAEFHALAEDELPQMLVAVDTAVDYATDFGDSDSENESVVSEVDWKGVRDTLREQLGYIRERLDNIEAMIGGDDDD